MTFLKRSIPGYGTVNMEYMGSALQRSPYFIKQVQTSPQFAQVAPFQAMLTIIGGATVKPTIIPASIFRWNARWNRPEPIRILAVTGSPVVGPNGPTGTITLSEGSLYTGAKVKLEDDRTNLYLTNRRPAGVGFTYDWQITGRPSTDAVDSTYLAAGRTVSYVTATYGEASSKSHPMRWSGSNEYMNVMEITRHHVQLTGSALTEAMRDPIVIESKGTDKNGKPATHFGYLPNIKYKTGETLINFHLAAHDNNRVWGRGNFDPLTGYVYTKDEDGIDVPMTDGIDAQMEGCHVETFFPTDSVLSLKYALDRIINHLADARGMDTIDLYAYGRPAARALWNKIMLMSNFANNGTVVINNADGGKIDKAGFGHIAQYETPAGKITFIVLGKNTLNDQRLQRVTVDGITANVRDFEMTFMPVNRVGNDGLSIQSYAKGENVNGKMIDRSLTLGKIPGMSGADTDGTTWQNVATTLDAARYEVLSDSGDALLNPEDCAKLVIIA